MPKIINGQAPTSKNLAPIKIIKNPVISKKNNICKLFRLLLGFMWSFLFIFEIIYIYSHKFIIKITLKIINYEKSR